MQKELPLKTTHVDWRNFKTSEELKKFLNTEQSARRLKFAVRVFYVLQWTKDHPEEMAKTGAMWCKDGFHFVCNSQLLGEFLLIKPNTINTNFRSHSFVIQLSQPHSLLTEFPNMHDIKNWRKRSNPFYSFTINSKESDIVLIPCKPNMNDLTKQNGFISSSQNVQPIIELTSSSQDVQTNPGQRTYRISPKFNATLFNLNQQKKQNDTGNEISLSQDPPEYDNDLTESFKSSQDQKTTNIQPLIIPLKSQRTPIPYPFFKQPIVTEEKSHNSIPIIIPDSKNSTKNPVQAFPPRLQHKYVLHSSLPEAVYNFVKNESEAILETELLFSKMKKSPTYKNAIILEALREWLEISDSPSAPFDKVCDYIVNDSDEKYKKKFYSNVSLLIRSPGSNITDTVPFASFVKFIAQYGYVPECQKNIMDLSSLEDDESFETWFQPFLSDAAVLQLMSKEPRDTPWILRPGAIVGMFSLHQYYNEKIITTSIDFNATANANENRNFSIVGEREGLIQAASIRHLLLDLLDLSGN